MGSFGAVVDTVEWVKKIQDRILDILSERSKISKAEIKESWDRKDWWLSSDDALKYGFVDIIE
jgi:ATP-dependent protease ClpP protease subunit